MMRNAIAALKIFGFALNILWLIPTQSIVLLFTKGKNAYVLTWIFQNFWRMLLGIKITVEGTPCTDKQVLYMANHISYLDIPAIGSVVKASFVAKSEVGEWPLAAMLSNMQQTAYIQRKRSKIAEEKNNLQTRIDKGESLIIFPEGTSTTGFDVLPFKSSLFMLALGENNQNLYIQPVTIRVLSVDGKAPASKAEQDIYAWPFDDDIEMHHHIWRFAKTKGAHLALTFHEPLRAADYSDRKSLARDCHERVSKGLDVQMAA